MNYRELLKDKKRVVIKVGSSSLIHKETNKLDLCKLEVLVRELSDLLTRARMLSWLLSGAVAVGASAFGMHEKPTELKKKQACSCSWTGASDDDLSETFFREQPDGGADSDDKEYDGQ